MASSEQVPPEESTSMAIPSTAENSVDLDDFMDVVTSYKCKFCEFSCTAPQKMAGHIKGVHLEPSSSSVPGELSMDTREGANSDTGQDANSDNVSSNSSNNASKLVNTIIPSSVSDGVRTIVIPSQAYLLPSSTMSINGPTVSEPVPQQKTVYSSEGNPTITPRLNLQQTSQKQTSPTVTIPADLRPAGMVTVGEGETAQNNTIEYAELSLSTVGSQSSQLDNVRLTEINVNNISEGTTMEGSENISQINNDIPSNVQTLDQAVKALMIPRSSLAETSLSIGKQTSTSVSDPTLPDVPAEYSNFVTREIFLCGQCNIGFNSIEECRVHMVQDHDINLPFPQDKQVTECVSIATQVGSQKRPGRKKKSEMPVKNPPKKHDSDEECLIQNINSTRSQRKRRPPKALKEDYFLGKKKRHKTKEKSKIMENYTIKCPITGCVAKFKTEESVDLHVKCHMDGDENFKCSNCELIFPYWRLLRQHLWKDHSVDIDLFQCEKCSFKTDTPHKLAVHQEIHGNDRPYTCDICGKGFKQYSQMRNHQTTHTEHQSSDPNKWYHSKECDVCKKSFANQKCLIKHQEAVHSDIKPFACVFCGYAAARKAMLMLHLRTHTGEKPFRCDICPYSSGDHNSLRRHKMRHTGQKPYKCQYCSYSCIQSVSLKTHLKNKHPGCDTMYLCNLCNYQSVNKTNFDYHMSDHRNGLIPLSKTKTKKSKNDSTTVQTIQNSSVSVPTSDASLVEMQVLTLDSGEAQISAEDLAKLTSYESFLSTELNAAQLIYSALSAISQEPETRTDGENIQIQSHILGGVETTIMSAAPKEGVTTHTITFHLPTSTNTSSQNVVTEDAQPPLQVVYANEIDIGIVPTQDNQLQIDEMEISNSADKELSVENRNTLEPS